MQKARALELLGGTPSCAAEAIGITVSAISQWPQDLPARLVDRVLAAVARRYLPASLIGEESRADEKSLKEVVRARRREQEQSAGRPDAQPVGADARWLQEAQAVALLKERGYSVFKGTPL